MATAGDIFCKSESGYANGDYFTTQPGSGNEVVIHNISHSGSCVLEYRNQVSDNFIEIDSHTGAGSWMGMFLHSTQTLFYRVRATNATTITIACDGVYTKVA